MTNSETKATLGPDIVTRIELMPLFYVLPLLRRSGMSLRVLWGDAIVYP
jgi:hypothetical protein